MQYCVIKPVLVPSRFIVYEISFGNANDWFDNVFVNKPAHISIRIYYFEITITHFPVKIFLVKTFKFFLQYSP